MLLECRVGEERLWEFLGLGDPFLLGMPKLLTFAIVLLFNVDGTVVVKSTMELTMGGSIIPFGKTSEV